MMVAWTQVGARKTRGELSSDTWGHTWTNGILGSHKGGRGKRRRKDIRADFKVLGLSKQAGCDTI